MRDFNVNLEFNMSRSLANQRRLAAQRQAYKCFYCGLPMWEAAPSAFAAKFNLSLAQAALLQCTAEHLHPRSNGGSDAISNIVAACHFCNRTRHTAAKPLSPSKYETHVKTRMAKGGWLAGILPPSLSSQNPCNEQKNGRGQLGNSR